MKKRVKVLHGKKRKGYADGGAPDAPDTLPNLDFLQMVAQNPRGWGNGPGPASPDQAYATPSEPMTPGAAMMKLIAGAAKTEPPRLADPEQVGKAALQTAPIPALGRGLNAAFDLARAYPKASAGILGGLDYLTGPSEAGSPQLTKSQMRELEIERQQREQDTAQKEALINAQAEADRRRGESDALIAAQKAKKSSELAEYNRQVAEAQQARNFELSRDRRFSDTSFGQAYNSQGGAGPVEAAILSGLLGRAASGPGVSAAGKITKDYVLPALEGFGGAFAGTNAPLFYNSMSTEPDNPRKLAYQRYSEMLPQGHPDKQKFADMAAAMPDQNPVQKQAMQDFVGPELPSRIGISALEGPLSGIFGANAPRIAGRAWEGLKGLFTGAGPEAEEAASSAAQALPPLPRRALSAPTSAPTSTPRVVIKSKAGTYHDESGRFTSNPRKSNGEAPANDNE